MLIWRINKSNVINRLYMSLDLPMAPVTSNNDRPRDGRSPRTPRIMRKRVPEPTFPLSLIIRRVLNVYYYVKSFMRIHGPPLSRRYWLARPLRLSSLLFTIYLQSILGDANEKTLTEVTNFLNLTITEK